MATTKVAEQRAMTSTRKLASNRINAGNSTGPRTRHGRARASRNAYKHGLSIDVMVDSQWVDGVQRLALTLVGEAADEQSRAQGLELAAALVELRRLRKYRVTLLNSELASAAGGDQKSNRVAVATHKVLPVLDRLERYERRAQSRRARALRAIMLRSGLERLP
jgi:hypothetical protein